MTSEGQFRNPSRLRTNAHTSSVVPNLEMESVFTESSFNDINTNIGVISRVSTLSVSVVFHMHDGVLPVARCSTLLLCNGNGVQHGDTANGFYHIHPLTGLHVLAIMKKISSLKQGEN